MTPMDNMVPDDLRDDEPATDEEIQRVISKADSLLNENDKLKAELQPFIHEWLQRLAGVRLEALIQAEEGALSYLDDPDAGVRTAALYLAVKYGEASKAVRVACERLACEDPDPEVRDTAIRELGTCYARSKDLRIGRLLASFANNAHLPDATRVRAFTALLRMHGYRDYTGPSPRLVSTVEQIDWQFVQKYLS